MSTPEPSAAADAALLDLIVEYRHERNPGRVLALYAAIEAALSRPATPPLNVERLARAYFNVMGRPMSSNAADVFAVVEEYAALANPTPEDA